MNKFYFGFAALALGMIFGASAALAVVEVPATEESTEVSSQVSVDTYSEESTEVAEDQDSETPSNGGEESTEVGNGDSDNDVNYEEETTEVIGDVTPEVKDEDEGRSSRSRSGQKKSSNRPSSQGEVLGDFTGSCPFLTSYMRIGQANDIEEVKKLQQFLNDNLSIDLPVTGFFGEMTDKAVRDFQLKLKDDVLLPWVEAGLHDSVENSTGYVYKTTLHTINKIVCPDMEVALPVLN